MLGRQKQIYQFKITLKRTKPPVWRRIQVPARYSFWELHVAIQDAMGWLDCHLHEFQFGSRPALLGRIGIPDDEFPSGRETLPGWKTEISKWFREEGASATYTYDFGDTWEHKVLLEKILSREDGEDYPKCLAGRRACPPEDCGGVWGYEELCNGTSLWQEAHADFDPDDFSVGEVYFDDPAERLRLLSR